jgi:radical SAM superfamily enzyme with C-terminal helix-hairpin-helix motif
MTAEEYDVVLVYASVCTPGGYLGAVKKSAR